MIDKSEENDLMAVSFFDTREEAKAYNHNYDTEIPFFAEYEDGSMLLGFITLFTSDAELLPIYEAFNFLMDECIKQGEMNDFGDVLKVTVQYDTAVFCIKKKALAA